jgi:hypothetical protein
VIDWAILKEAWVSEPSEYQVESGIRAVTRQTSTASGVAGTTVPLPAVTTAKGSPNPITWTVKSGDASIDAAAGKVTYNSAGPVMLTWSDSLAVTKECAPGDAGYSSTPPHYICLSTGQPPTGTVDVSFFSGQVSVNVTEADEEPPTPDAPSTDTTKDDIIASSTGGAARLADGDDSYDVITTIRSADGTPLTGYADRLTATAANEVNLGVITDNGDGTYTIQVSSDTPGNYEVTITLEDENGQGVIIDSIPVNFIGADIDQPTRRVSDEQAADGLGFLPGEQVKVTVHSDPIELGTLAADANGSVPVSFTIPEGFDIGRHTVDFVGETSGAVKVAFDVIDPSAITDPTNSADPTTGGGVATTPTAPGAKGDTGGQAGGSQTDILRLALIAMALGVIATGIVTLRRRSDNS